MCKWVQRLQRGSGLLCVSVQLPGMVLIEVHKARQLQLLQLLSLAPARLGLLHSQQALLYA